MSLNNWDALVLSSGGFKGFLQLGSLHNLFLKGLNFNEIKMFSGCSIGSVICLLLCIGYTPIEIFEEVINTKFGVFIKLNSLQDIYSKTGLMCVSEAFSFLDNLVIKKVGYIPTLLELKKEFQKELYSCVLNLTLSRCEYLSFKNYPDMSCTRAVQLSSNIPIVFNKITEDGNVFVDGGLRNAVPYEPVYKKENRILIISTPGASCSSTEGIGYIHNVIASPINALMEQRIAMIPKDIYIVHLKKDGVPVFEINANINDKISLFTIGYERTSKLLNTKYIKVDVPDMLWIL